MKCRLIKRYLAAYTENELNNALANLVERHLQTCEGCAKEAESYFRLSDWMQEARRDSTPVSNASWEAVRARIVQPALRPAPAYKQWMPVSAVAAGAILFVAMRQFAPLAPSDHPNQENPATPPVIASLTPIEVPVTKEEKTPKPTVEAHPSISKAVQSETRERARTRIENSRKDPFAATSADKRNAEAKSAPLTGAPKIEKKNPAPSKPKVTEINPPSTPLDRSEATDHNSDEVQWNY